MIIEDNGGRAFQIFFEEIPLSLLVAPQENDDGMIRIFAARHYVVNGGGIITMLYGEVRDIRLKYFGDNINSIEDLKKFVKENPTRFFEIVFTVVFSRVERLAELEEKAKTNL
jgi:hypothetical protein